MGQRSMLSLPNKRTTRFIYASPAVLRREAKPTHVGVRHGTVLKR
jgi:hypothetical protein